MYKFKEDCHNLEFGLLTHNRLTYPLGTILYPLSSECEFQHSKLSSILLFNSAAL